MILSHKNKFILIKSGKTASTSLEVYFSSYCGPDDIITPIREKIKWHKAINSKDFEKHDNLKEILDKIDKDWFENYFKFTSIRNPWDKMVSIFNWNRTPLRLRKYGDVIEVDDYKKCIRKFRRWLKKLYTNKEAIKGVQLEPFCQIEGNYLVNDIVRFEFFVEDIKKICKKLKLRFRPRRITHTKKSKPKDFNGYVDYYDKSSRYIVEDISRFEIEKFGYRFG